MRLSIPGLPGVYYDTDSDSAALTTVFTFAGRRAPKPQGYALQALPFLWSVDVDLREVPENHPFQYLHPEGARSLEALPREREFAAVGRDLDYALRFLAAINDQTEAAFSDLLGFEEELEGVVIEIDEGDVVLRDREDGEETTLEIDDEAAGDGPTDPGPEDVDGDVVRWDESGDETERHGRDEEFDADR